MQINTQGLFATMAFSFPVRAEVEFIRPLSDENQRLVN